MSQQNKNSEEYDFIKEFARTHCYNLKTYDFSPFWTTVKQIQQTLQQVCGTKRQSAHVSLNLTDIIFNGCKENQNKIKTQYYNQLAHSTIKFIEKDATYFDPFWLEKEYYHYNLKQPRHTEKEHANHFYKSIFYYGMLKAHIDLTQPFKATTTSKHVNPTLKMMSNITVHPLIDTIDKHSVHMQIDFDLNIHNN